MKIQMTQHDAQEIEVHVKYYEMDATVKNLIQKIQSCNHTLSGNSNGRQYMINIYDIYYIESVDKKVFIYTKDQVYRSDQKLYTLHDSLKQYDFVQISKSCILNLDVLESIETLYNSRMHANLSNGEKITVSRTYLSVVKAALGKEGGNQ